MVSLNTSANHVVGGHVLTILVIDVEASVRNALLHRIQLVSRDFEGFVQWDKQESLSIDKRFGKEMLHHVAEIPNAIIVKMQREHNLDVFSTDPNEQKRLRRLLESPDYRYLKTTVSKLWRPT